MIILPVTEGDHHAPPAVALVRMYGQSMKLLANLPRAERGPYLERLDKLRSRSNYVGYGVQDELNSLWCDADFDERLE